MTRQWDSQFITRQHASAGGWQHSMRSAPSSGSVCAASTAGCALLGPGPISRRSGTCTSQLPPTSPRGTCWLCSCSHACMCMRMHGVHADASKQRNSCVIGGLSALTRTTILSLKAAWCVVLMGGHSSPCRPETAEVLIERRHIWPWPYSRCTTSRLDMMVLQHRGPAPAAHQDTAPRSKPNPQIL